MGPAFAHALVLLSEARRALSVPSPGKEWKMYRNESAGSQMSPPPAWMVHAPPARFCAPAGVAPPISVQFHAAMQMPAGCRPVVVSDTVSNLTVPITFALCAVTARPASVLPVMLSTMVDPGTAVQEVPFGDV